MDNLLWDRELAEQLLNFDYTWEVYKPVVQRRFGYYVLPVLYGDGFVARFEPGRDKKNGALIIKNWWWEPDVTPSAEMRNGLRDCFQDFLDYLDTDTLEIDGTLAKQKDLDWLM